jgi:DNA-binding LacI/PurR family transcriptional regulator
MATIKDVAKFSGVSIGTVSRFLNGIKVKEANYIKIKQAIQELNFYPSLSARNLKQKLNRTISLHLSMPSDHVVYNSTWWFYQKPIQGFIDYALSQGYQTNIKLVKLKDFDRYDEIISYVIGENIDMCAFIIPHVANYQVLKELKKENKRVVTLYSRPFDCINSVTTNDFEISKSVVQWLKKMGHGKIAYISGKDDMYCTEERKNGYLSGVKNENSSYQMIFNGDWNIQSGIDALKYFFSQDEPPTAICCANDFVAAGVVKACRQLRIRVPRDLSIIGWDNINVISMLDIALSTIEAPLLAIGIEAAKILLSEKEESPKHRLIPSKFLIKESTSSILE